MVSIDYFIFYFQEAFNSYGEEGNPSVDRISKVRQDVEDVKGIMTQNIGKEV